MKTCARKGCIELAFPGGYFDGLCGRECQNMVEAYQRGRDEERAEVVAYLDMRNLWHARNAIEKGEHEVKR